VLFAGHLIGSIPVDHLPPHLVKRAHLSGDPRSDPLSTRILWTRVRQFYATANARLQASVDFDAKRQFVVDHVERVIYNRYNVTIAGSVPVQTASGESKLPFRIEGKIDIAAIRSAASRKAALAAAAPQMKSPSPFGEGESRNQVLRYSVMNVRYKR
jgi:hypothetical protein